ncbi:thiamine pyrophosphate-binding protein [Candidatus Bathyarchaeota archaeon A05DMB-2]|jgi:thiamine pyrophosphate-dependent acetolactate synthase large subunit-like protein/rubredoxin|nr:thiamine pyrophosphate-binding protein [Candidatus Bathyarchaeota archaeon A05DMB-2]
MAKYRCTVCNYVYDEDKEKIKFSDLPKEWVCPVCGAPKTAFVLLTEAAEEKKVERTVSEVLIEQAAEWGVQYVFGIPGTSTLGVVDAIRKSNGKVKYLQVRHEQTAAFMASAYGKLTGHVAACLGVSGPGATNLATGLYDASLDHAPVLALTGLVARQLIGPGSTQEIDQYSFFEPICVFNKILMSEDQTTTLTTLAIKHALLERGVSHIGIPNDVQKLPCNQRILPLEGRIPNLAFSQEDALVEKAASVIDRAMRPVIIAGFGAMGQGGKLLKLAAKISAPIVTTFRAKGVVDEDDALCVGCHGTIASTAAAELVRKADLLIVVGSSFSELTQIPEKPTVQIDINPMIIAKTYPVEVGLLGNSAVLLPKLIKKVKENLKPTYMAEISKLKQGWQEQLQREADGSLKPIRPQYIIKVLNDKIAADAVISLDVGENCWWFGRNFQMKQTQKMVMSGYLASMGFGLPGAMAAALAYPDRQVVCIVGDGGFSMLMADFLTALKYGMHVKVFIMNNGRLGMIMQEQKVEGYESWQTELYNFDFADYAEHSGGIGIKVTEPSELEGAVEKALSAEKATIVDIETDPRRFL